jgi:hypothetical protein
MGRGVKLYFSPKAGLALAAITNRALSTTGGGQ